MAKMVLTDASVSIDNSGGTPVDLSDHVRQITINYEAELLDATAMGDGSRTRVVGYKDWNMTIEFLQDYDAASVDATLFDVVGVSGTVTIKPTSAAVSATNPSFAGEAFLQSYSPISGSVGDVNSTSCSFQGNGTLTRATS